MKLKTNTLFNYFLFFLPFTQALTINLFFPLKISELLLFLIFFIFIQKKWNHEFIKTMKKAEVLFLFLIVVSFSFLANSFWVYDYTLKSIPFRIGKIPDSFLRLVYIYINVIAFVISIYFIGKNKISSLNYWINGAILAAIYGWYLFIFSALDLPYFKLFGMDDNPQTLMGIVRTGTFKEGNFFSLFLILSCSIAFYLKKVRTAWFFIITVLTTFSTIGLLSAFLFLLVYFKRRIFKKYNIKIFLLTSPAILVAIIFLLKTDFYEKYVYDKLFTPIENLTPSNLSKVDRYLTGRIAFKEGVNNPFVGVGPNNYPLHYDKYNNIKDIVKNNTEWSLNYFKRENRKAIPNNVYLEVWAEYGIIGFLLFLLFLLNTLFVAIRIKNVAIIGGLVAMYLSLNAFPSFIMIFLWVFFAIPYALLYQQQISNSKK